MDHICTICGYRYREEKNGPIPPDFICPLCGADLRAFTPLPMNVEEKET